MSRRIVVAVTVTAVAGVAWLAGWAYAGAVSRTPAQLEAGASEIVVGQVQRVYTHEAVEGKYRKTYHIAEMTVTRQEKGKQLTGPIYVRYFRLKYVGAGPPPPGTSGHRGLPKAGDSARVYLKRGKDGGLDVLFPNGFEVGAK